MGKSIIRIGSYEIDDAHLSTPEAKGGDKVHIPCKSDPDLCMQLDAWDDHTRQSSMAVILCCIKKSTTNRKMSGSCDWSNTAWRTELSSPRRLRSDGVSHC